MTPLPTPAVSQSTFRTVYLGTPGAMTKLAVPSAGVAYPLSRGGAATDLLSGGVSVMAQPRARRKYSFSWPDQTYDDADPILGFYLGYRGTGPFCLLDPSWRNQLAQRVSTFGRQLQAISGWSTPTSGALSYDATYDPANLAKEQSNCGVARWTSPVSGQVMLEGSYSGSTMVPSAGSLTDAGTAVPYLPDQTHTLTLSVRVPAGVSIARLVAVGLPVAGSAAPPMVYGVATAITTAWQPLTVALRPGTPGFSASSTPLICLGLRCESSSGLSLLSSCPSHEVGVASASGAWVSGLGVPRVMINDDNAAGVTVWDRRSQALTLSEI